MDIRKLFYLISTLALALMLSACNQSTLNIPSPNPVNSVQFSIHARAAISTTRVTSDKVDVSMPLKLLESNPSEGDSNHSNHFSLQISSSLTTDASVSYITQAGTATEGVDYLQAAGTATIPAGLNPCQYQLHLYQKHYNVNVPVYGQPSIPRLII